jgi:hypothetical protein
LAFLSSWITGKFELYGYYANFGQPNQRYNIVYDFSGGKLSMLLIFGYAVFGIILVVMGLKLRIAKIFVRE